VNATTAALSLLLAILGISAQWGLAEALVASVAAMVGFNLLFLPPVGKLTIQDPQNWVALAAFLVTAVTASQLSAHARRRAAEAEARPPGNRTALRAGAIHDAHRQRAQDHPRVRQSRGAGVRLHRRGLLLPAHRRVLPLGTGKPGGERPRIAGGKRSGRYFRRPRSRRRPRARAAGRTAVGKYGAHRVAAFQPDGARHRQSDRHHHREGARAGRRQPRGSRAPERGAEIGAARFAGARYQNAAHFHQGRRHQPAGKRARRRPRTAHHHQ
jgi:hypothetical protein